VTTAATFPIGETVRTSEEDSGIVFNSALSDFDPFDRYPFVAGVLLGEWTSIFSLDSF